ncbi:hypothetical protein B5F53_19295 [Blautia sp. An249]|nr:hypothetical protein B5F53_19295 [Blautia sp. An249]
MIICGQGEGAWRPIPYNMGIIFTGMKSIAIDCTIAKLMGIDLDSIWENYNALWMGKLIFKWRMHVMATPEQYKEKELDNCTLIKAVLMLAVCLGHCANFWTGGWFNVVTPKYQSDTLIFISKWLNSFHIYCFVLISGYLYSYNRNECGKYNVYKTFITKKTKRLILPYVFVTISFVIPIESFLYDYSLEQIIEKYVLCESPSHLWFLWMLFWLFIIIWPLTKKFSNDWMAIVISTMSYVIGTLGGLRIPNYFCIFTSLSYVPFFIIGMKLREKRNWFIRKVSLTIYCVLYIICFMAWSYFADGINSIEKIIYIGLGLVLHIIGAISIFFLLQRLANIITWEKSKLWGFLSKRSMMVYLYHQQLIYFSILWFNGLVPPFFNFLLNFGVALVGALIISSALLRFRYTRFFFNNRN